MAYSAGIIGTGGVAGTGIVNTSGAESVGSERSTRSHAGAYDAVDGVELVAASDVDAEALDRFGDLWDVPPDRRYADPAAMLDAEDLDVVSVCSPTMFHHEHVQLAATTADPDAIWCEKPVAANVADADDAIRACDETDTALVVNHSYRFRDNWRALRSLVREESIVGDVQSITLQFRMELLRNATHLLDLLDFLFDADASMVSGHLTGENELGDALGVDATLDDVGGGGTVVLDDGTLVTVDCTVPRDYGTMFFAAVGSAGKLYVNTHDDEWRYWDLRDGDHVECPLPGVEDDHLNNNFVAALEHVLDVIEGQATNRSPGDAARKSLEMMVGLFVSDRTDSHVDLPLEPPLRDVTVRSW